MIKRSSNLTSEKKNLEESGLSDIENLLSKNDVKVICKRIYDKCYKTGLYCLIKQRQPNLLLSLNNILEKQQKDLEQCKRIINGKKRITHTIKDCQIDPNTAINFYLNNYPIV